MPVFLFFFFFSSVHFFWDQGCFPLCLKEQFFHGGILYCLVYIWKWACCWSRCIIHSWSQMTAFCLSFSAMCFLGYCICSHSHWSFSSASICALSIRPAGCATHCYLCVFHAQQFNVLGICGIMEIHVYKCCITWARTYLFKKTVCILDHGMSRGNSLTEIPSPADSCGKSLFHHSQEALAFTCFFCLSVIPFMLVMLMIPLLKASRDGSKLSWAFCEIVSPFRNRDAMYFLHDLRH